MTSRTPRALALVAALVTAAGLAGPAAAGPRRAPDVAHGRAATTAAERADVAAYWTPARMRAANSGRRPRPRRLPGRGQHRRRRPRQRLR